MVWPQERAEIRAAGRQVGSEALTAFTTTGQRIKRGWMIMVQICVEQRNLRESGRTTPDLNSLIYIH